MELKNVKITRIGSKDNGSPYFKIGAKEFVKLGLDDKKLYNLTFEESVIETKKLICKVCGKDFSIYGNAEVLICDDCAV